MRRVYSRHALITRNFNKPRNNKSAPASSRPSEESGYCRLIFLNVKKPYLPQHFLYFFPLPHGQGSLRPTFFSAIFVFSGFNNISKFVISSGLSGSNSIVYFQPFSSNTDSNSFTLSSVCTFTTAGLFSVPNFAVFLPSNIFFIFSPLRDYKIHLPHNVEITCLYGAESPEFVEGAESPEVVEKHQRNTYT